jgi:hypothetical protein
MVEKYSCYYFSYISSLAMIARLSLSTAGVLLAGYHIVIVVFLLPWQSGD